MSQQTARFAVLSVVAATVLASYTPPDEGMWLFNKPPKELLKKQYGFETSNEWLEHVQKSAVRFSTGGSGSIVSATGLVMTNHHVGRDMLEKMSTAQRNFVETGFYAKTPGEEVKSPDLELDLLWTIQDVTDRIEGAAKGLSTAEAGAAKRKAMSVVQDEAHQSTGLKCEVVPLYQGGRYHLYCYKHYTDVRLVFAPEQQIAFYGGDNDNFEYPRYDLDCCFFRIYDNDAPLKAEHYLRWSQNGSADGDLVFVAGHPGSTQRMFTVANLEYLRDTRYPVALARLWRTEVQLRSFAQRNAEYDRIARTDFFGVQNTRKAFTGTLAGLLDPALFARKTAAEKKLRDAVDANPEMKAKWGDAWDQIARAEQTWAGLYRRYVAVGGGGIGIGGDLAGYAATIVRLGVELPKKSSDRLREYADSNLESLYLHLYSPAPVYKDFEMMKLESSISYMAEQLGATDPTVVAVLAGKSPHERALELVGGTKLLDVAERKRLVDGGQAAVDASKDPLIALVKSLDGESRSMRKTYEDQVQSAEREGYAKIAAAKFAIEGENQYPDATFTLRLSFGTVKGYRENNADVPPFTDIGGLYKKNEARPQEADFVLPPTWTAAREAVAKATPFNFVSTCDIIGGNSGSPVINRAGEVVGLIFDGNIQSLTGGIAYSDEQSRAVSVDSRAMVEALRSVYKAQPLVDELKSSTVAR